MHLFHKDKVMVVQYKYSGILLTNGHPLTTDTCVILRTFLNVRTMSP